MFLHVLALPILPNYYNLIHQTLFLKIPPTQNSKLKTQNCHASATQSASNFQSKTQPEAKRKSRAESRDLNQMRRGLGTKIRKFKIFLTAFIVTT